MRPSSSGYLLSLNRKMSIHSNLSPELSKPPPPCDRNLENHLRTRVYTPKLPGHQPNPGPQDRPCSSPFLGGWVGAAMKESACACRQARGREALAVRTHNQIRFEIFSSGSENAVVQLWQARCAQTPTFHYNGNIRPVLNMYNPEKCIDFSFGIKKKWNSLQLSKAFC